MNQYQPDFRPITYEVYEDGRDLALHPDSLRITRLYVVRMMLPIANQTQAEYAHEYTARLDKIRHLGGFSLIEVLYAPGFAEGVAAGINHNGIIFNDEPMPADIGSIPFEDELGYFASEAPAAVADESEAEKVSDYLGGLVLTA